MELKIGAFSNSVKISKRMLRYYDEKNLLNPFTDKNGYRVYNEKDLKKAEKIKFLRDLGFGVEEIIIFFESDAEKREKLYKKKLQDIEKSSRINEDSIRRIESIIYGKSLQKFINRYEIMQGIRKKFHAAVLRDIASENEIDSLFLKLEKRINKSGSEIVGKPFSLIYESDCGDSSESDILCGFPVTGDKTSDLLFFDKSEVLQTLHYGPYEDIGNAYWNIYSYGEKKGLWLKEPFREIYITDCFSASSPLDYVTLIEAEIIS